MALIKAETADRWGNLTFRLAARNFAPTMAMAAALTVVQARKIVDLGAINPELVVTPGVFVDRVVEVSNPAAAGRREDACVMRLAVLPPQETDGVQPSLPATLDTVVFVGSDLHLYGRLADGTAISALHRHARGGASPQAGKTISSLEFLKVSDPPYVNGIFAVSGIRVPAKP